MTQFVQYGIIVAVLDKRCTQAATDKMDTCTTSCVCCTCNNILISFNERRYSGGALGQSEDASSSHETISHSLLHPMLHLSSVAYILHTSGSTGVPKKVQVHPTIVGLVEKFRAGFTHNFA